MVLMDRRDFLVVVGLIALFVGCVVAFEYCLYATRDSVCDPSPLSPEHVIHRRPSQFVIGGVVVSLVALVLCDALWSGYRED